MGTVNASSDYIVGIEEAFVYGSYLSDAERLGDLDISVTLYRKDGFNELADAHAKQSGRKFALWIERLGWPEKQVFLFLKQRSRVFSIHHDERLLADPAVPRRPIFLKRAAVPR